jgi:hypothetical protein
MGEDGARAPWLQLLRAKEERQRATVPATLQYHAGTVHARAAEDRRLGFHPARVFPGSLRKPETIICFCLIFQIESYKYLYVSLIAIIIK